MPEFIYQLSSFSLLLFLTVTLFFISFLSLVFMRRMVPMEYRHQENSAIMSSCALLGTIYAILVGFTILYQLNSFNKAETAENAEGVALYDIYQTAILLPANDAAKIRTAVIGYAKNAIYYEWPALGLGEKIDSRGAQILANIAHHIDDALSRKHSESMGNVLNNMSKDVNALIKLHHERIIKIYTSINGHLWFVLLLGTFLTILMNAMIGMDFRLHCVCLGLISMMIASILYLLVCLNRPYQGDFVVRPITIQAVLENNL